MGNCSARGFRKEGNDVLATPVRPLPVRWSCTDGRLPARAGGSLQCACISAVAGLVSDGRYHAGQLSALPSDIVQEIFDELVATEVLTPEVAAAFAGLGLHHLLLSGYRQLTDACLAALDPRSQQHLSALDLSHCPTLTDAALGLLAGLQHLRTLRLDSCVLLQDAGALSSLVALKELSLAGCEGLAAPGLSAALPRLTALTSLNLEQCGQGLNGLACLSGLQRLVVLRLGWCGNLLDPPGGGGDPCASLAPLARLSALQQLDMSRALAGPACDRGMALLAPLTGLKSLSLAGADITPDGLACLCGLQGLTRLVLAQCSRLGDQAGPALAALPGLCHLDLSYTGLGDEGCSALGALTALTWLSLENCGSVSDAGLKPLLAAATRLHCLNLADTCAGDASCTAMGLRLRGSLASLNMSYSRITHEGVADLAACSALQHLSLDVASLNDAAVRPLARLAPSLLSLDLYGARVGDAGLASLAACTNLQRLELCSGLVSDAGCAYLTRLQGLRALSLAHNAKVGDGGLAALGHLPLLESLNLSDTGCSGQLVFQLINGAWGQQLRALTLTGCSRVSATAVHNLHSRRPGLLVKHDSLSVK